MEDSLPPLAALTQFAPKLALPPASDLPSDFIPMRLHLEPAGLVLDVDKPIMVLGRHSEADVRLALPDVSRRHCRFVFSDGSWRMFDLNSLNGVFVNDEKLQEATIFHGDKVRIGGLTFGVDLGKGAERPQLRKAS